MRAGRRNKKVTIESASEVVNGVGDVVRTWTTFATAFASIETNGGKEFIQQQSIYSELTHLLTIRYITGVKANMRVNNGGVFYDILAAYDPTGRRIDLKVPCREL